MDLFFKRQQLDGNMLKHLVPPDQKEADGYFLIEGNQLYWSQQSKDKFSRNEKRSKILEFDGEIYLEDSYYFPEFDPSGIYNANFISTSFLYLQFNNGRIRERKMVKHFTGYKDFIQFGKYKGKSYSSLLYGIPSEPSDILKRMFRYLVNKSITKCVIPKDALDKIVRLEHKLNSLDEVSLDGYVDRGEVARSLKIIAGNDSFLIYKDELGENFYGMVDEFIAILECNFLDLVCIENDKITLNNESDILALPDFNYITWAIENVENFCVLPNYFNEEMTFFEGFTITNVKDNLYEFTPKYVTFKVADKFTKEIVEKNFTKFCSLENVKFNASLDFYELNDTMNSDFALYWIHDKQNNYYGDEDELHEDEYFDTPKYYNNPWLASLPPDEASEAYSNTD